MEPDSFLVVNVISQSLKQSTLHMVNFAIQSTPKRQYHLGNFSDRHEGISKICSLVEVTAGRQGILPGADRDTQRLTPPPHRPGGGADHLGCGGEQIPAPLVNCHKHLKGERRSVAHRREPTDKGPPLRTLDNADIALRTACVRREAQVGVAREDHAHPTTARTPPLAHQPVRGRAFLHQHEATRHVDALINAFPCYN